MRQLTDFVSKELPGRYSGIMDTPLACPNADAMATHGRTANTPNQGARDGRFWPPVENCSPILSYEMFASDRMGRTLPGLLASAQQSLGLGSGPVLWAADTRNSLELPL